MENNKTKQKHKKKWNKLQELSCHHEWIKTKNQKKKSNRKSKLI